MKRKKTLIAFLVLLVILIWVCITRIYLPISGTVVDAETGKPIEGATVFVWWTMPGGPVEILSSTTYKTMETVTDKEGKFRINGFVLNPIVNKPDLTIYKAGYVCWNNNFKFPGFKPREEFQWESNRRYLLEKFRNEYSRTEHVSFIEHFMPGLDVRDPFRKAYEWEEMMSLKELRQKRVEGTK
ncbi:MAG TPA: hypothetical protein VN328_12230 [Thermodesulfovibrionales bacterium]|nr:hypothetical protein [Thermodesulfovibrionales bacterium]